MTVIIRDSPAASPGPRTPDAVRDVLRLAGEGAALVTPLPLGADAVTAMVTEAFGAPPDPDLADLAGGAAGDPALLAELIGGLRDENAVRVSAGRATLSSPRLPGRVHRLARRRLDDLSPPARSLLMTAALLGPAFRLEDAAEMLGQTPAGLLPAIEETMDAAIMTAAGRAFAFRHPLLRRAVGELIPAPARLALHRQYGELLLARGEDADRAASHLLQAADPADRPSLAGLDRAAAQTRGSAPQTAAGLAVRALELTAPADPAALARTVAAAEALTVAGQLGRAERLAGAALSRPLPPAAEARLRCVLAAVLGARGRARAAADQARLVLARPQLPDGVRDDALTALLPALAGLRDEGAGPAADAVLAGPARGDDGGGSSEDGGGPAIAAAQVTRAVLAWDAGQVRAGLDRLREAARHGTGISPDARQVQPLLALAAALVDLREVGEAADLLGAAGGPGTPALRGTPASAALWLLRGRIHLAAGRPADAAAAAEAALVIARAAGADGYAAIARGLLSMVELRRGDLAAAAAHIAARPAAGPQFADLYARAEAAAAAAQVTEAREGPAAAISQVRQLCAGLPARPGRLLGDPALAAWLTRTALAADEDELAARVARAAQALADAAAGCPALAAAAAHSQGLAGRDSGRLAEAVALHPDSWAGASAAEDLGAWHARQGERDQAIGWLKEALGGYGRAGAGRDQARIRRRLRQLGIRRRHWAAPAGRPDTGWPSLTDTERAVAALVAQGLSNGQVAARMYISPHTVAHHLRQAFRKLSIASRVELTRIVLEQARGSR
jgi:DNA-binding CsgD family transcriptional regulator